MVGSLSGLLSEEKCEDGMLGRCSGSKKWIGGFIGGFIGGWKLGTCGWLTSLGTLWYWGLLFFTLLEWCEAEAAPWLCPTLIWDLKPWPLAAQLLRLKLFSKFLLVQSSCHHSSPQVFSYVLNGYSQVKQWKGGRREAIYKMDYQKLDEGPKACLIWTQ